jgi:hypothetical protein
MAAQEEPAAPTSEQIDEKFSFPPGSSLKAIERNIHSQKTKEPEYYPTPTTPAYDPSKQQVKISLSTDVFAERSNRHVYPSGTKRKPTFTMPQDWADALGLDIENKENGHDMVTMELSADRTTVTIKKMEPPEGMRRPVGARLFAVDSDAAAEAAEREHEQQQKS